jgi:hypothetical protein
LLKARSINQGLQELMRLGINTRDQLRNLLIPRNDGWSVIIKILYKQETL